MGNCICLESETDRVIRKAIEKSERDRRKGKTKRMDDKADRYIVAGGDLKEIERKQRERKKQLEEIETAQKEIALDSQYGSDAGENQLHSRGSSSRNGAARPTSSRMTNRSNMSSVTTATAASTGSTSNDNGGVLITPKSRLNNKKKLKLLQNEEIPLESTGYPSIPATQVLDIPTVKSLATNPADNSSAAVPPPLPPSPSSLSMSLAMSYREAASPASRKGSSQFILPNSSGDLPVEESSGASASLGTYGDSGAEFSPQNRNRVSLSVSNSSLQNTGVAGPAFLSTLGDEDEEEMVVMDEDQEVADSDGRRLRQSDETPSGSLATESPQDREEVGEFVYGAAGSRMPVGDLLSRSQNRKKILTPSTTPRRHGALLTPRRSLARK